MRKCVALKTRSAIAEPFEYRAPAHSTLRSLGIKSCGRRSGILKPIKLKPSWALLQRRSARFMCAQSNRDGPYMAGRRDSAKGKRERLRAWIEKLDLKGAVVDRVFLTDELVQAVFGDLSVSVRIGVHSVILTRRLPVDLHAEADRLSVGSGPQHQVHVARVETIDDLAWRGVESSQPGRGPSNCRRVPID